MPQPWRNATLTTMPSRSAPSTVRSLLLTELSRVEGEVEPGQICAYNQTRECFLGVHVVSGDFTLSSFKDWLATLRPNSGAGMWMAPFRGIPASEVHTPLDLLYIDLTGRVIEAVEFFPTFKVSPGSAPAASVLALPTHSIFSSKTEAGDQLILCPAEEIEWRLDQLVRTGAVIATAPPAQPGPPSRLPAVREESKPAAGPVLVFEAPKKAVETALTPVSIPIPVYVPEARQVNEEPVAPVVAAEVQQSIPPVAEPVAQTPVQAPSPAPAQTQASPEKPWMHPTRQQQSTSPLSKLGRWLFSDPADPRRTNRRPVPGLVAHFFTGGAPQAHPVRDVSPTGLYVVTTERWYPGTVIRMTLTKPDMGQSPADRSITIQARAVRWGNDGVGLEFVLVAARKGSSREPSALDPIDARQLDQFLKRLSHPQS